MTINTRRIFCTVAALAILIGSVEFSTAAEGKKHKKDGAASEPSTQPAAGQVLSLRGVVRNGSDPVAGVEVKLPHTDYKPTTTDDKGQFAFYDLAPGTYTVQAGNDTTHTTVKVESGRVAEIVLASRGARPARTVRSGGVATPGHTPGHVHTPR